MHTVFSSAEGVVNTHLNIHLYLNSSESEKKLKEKTKSYKMWLLKKGAQVPLSYLDSRVHNQIKKVLLYSSIQLNIKLSFSQSGQ